MLKLHLNFYSRELLSLIPCRHGALPASAFYIAFTLHLLIPSSDVSVLRKSVCNSCSPNWLISNRNQRFCENLIFHSDAPSSLHRSARAIHCLFCFAFHYQSLSIESTRRCLKLTYYLFLPSTRKHKWKLLMLCDAYGRVRRGSFESDALKRISLRHPNFRTTPLSGWLNRLIPKA